MPSSLRLAGGVAPSTGAQAGPGMLTAPVSSQQTEPADSTLDRLKEAIQQIQQHNVSQLSFEEHYRYAYNLVLYKKVRENGMVEHARSGLTILTRSAGPPLVQRGRRAHLGSFGEGDARQGRSDVPSLDDGHRFDERDTSRHRRCGERERRGGGGGPAVLGQAEGHLG